MKMRLTCLPEELKKGLATVGRAVDPRRSLTVMWNVLLQTEEGRLKLAATNLELTVICWVEASIEEEGAITLPARRLADYVGLLGGGEPLRLTVQSEKAHVRCGRFEANVVGIDAKQFPAIPSVAGGASFTVPAPRLREAIRQVAFAAVNDYSRPVLAGVLMTVSGGKLTMTAADGFRMAVRAVDLGNAEVPDVTMIVPEKALTEVRRGLPTDGETAVLISVAPDQSQVSFRHQQAEVVSRLIEGQFPDFERIIPRDAKTRVTLRTADLLRATKAAQVFAAGTSMRVCLDLAPAEEGGGALGRVTVAATTSWIGDNTGDVDASVKGEPTQVAFNGKYLRDALEALGAEDAVLELNGPTSPGLIRPADGPSDCIQVIMPMRLPEE
jgi:DNA polymerase-3 subunit beta